MVQFIIPTETFVRLSHASQPYGSPDYKACQSVRLEYRDGGYYAVASNSRIIAVEYLGLTMEPNAAVNVALFDAETVKPDPAYGDNLRFDWFSEFSILTLNGGITIQAMPDNEPRFKEWWRVFPEAVPTKSRGAFYMDGELIAKLARSSPSGLLCFAAHVDRKNTAIVRDLHDPNWIGGFISDDIEHKAFPATLPDWMVK